MEAKKKIENLGTCDPAFARMEVLDNTVVFHAEHVFGGTITMCTNARTEIARLVKKIFSSESLFTMFQEHIDIESQLLRGIAEGRKKPRTEDDFDEVEEEEECDE